MQNRLEDNRELDEKDEKERRKTRRKKLDQQKEQLKKGYASTFQYAMLDDEEMEEIE